MTAIDGLNPDFLDLLRAFQEEAADFLVVGAFAVAYHGAPRATGDLDVFVRATPDNAVRVWRALARFGAPLASAQLAPEDLAAPGIVYQIGLPPRRIDVITRLSGVSFDAAWSSRETIVFEGRPVWIIGREALLTNKRAAARPKDLADVARLEGDE